MISLLLLGLAHAVDLSDEDRIAHAHALVPQVEAARHLTCTTEVPVRVQTQDDLRAEILAESLDEEAVDELRRASLSLRALHLAPDDLDLKAMMVDVLSAQIEAYYDPDEIRMSLVGRGGTDADDEEARAYADMVATHEWVHAIQDQHFDLWALRNRDFRSDDVDTAVLALVEGDASLAMTPGVADAEPGLAPMIARKMFEAAADSEDPRNLDPHIANMPPILRDSLVAPYTWGTRFAHALVRSGGWDAVDQAYSRPPLSTAQILHPELYLDVTAPPPKALDLPDVAPTLGPGWSRVESNALGELGVRSMVATHSPTLSWPARAAVAEGWQGDSYDIYEQTEGALAAVWRSTWATAADARAVSAQVQRWSSLFPTGLVVLRQGRELTALFGVAPSAQRDVLKQVARPGWTDIVGLDGVAPRRPEARAAQQETP